MKVAVLPAYSGSGSLPAQIGQALGGTGTVIVVAGKHISAASDRIDNAAALATQAIDDNGGAFTKQHVTGAIVELAGLVKNAENAAGSSGSTGSTSGSSSSSGSSHAGVIVAVLAVLVLAGAGGGTYYVMRSRRRKQQELADAKSDVDSLYQRLGGDILTLEPTDDDSVRQALADASERYNSGGSALVSATSIPQLKVARKTLIEGLHAARVARVKIGPGPRPGDPADQQHAGRAAHLRRDGQARRPGVPGPPELRTRRVALLRRGQHRRKLRAGRLVQHPVLGAVPSRRRPQRRLRGVRRRLRRRRLRRRATTRATRLDRTTAVATGAAAVAATGAAVAVAVTGVAVATGAAAVAATGAAVAAVRRR